MRHSIKKFCGLALVLGSWAITPCSYGADQASGSSNSPESTSGPKLEEVIVNARRREENVQSVPETVQVVSQEELSAQNVTSVQGLQYLVPGLSGRTSTPNSIALTLRGQGSEGNDSWPGVIVFLNEVPYPNFGGGASSFGPGQFFDLENIQVLKGPQGTLFGKSSVGGDILLRSARPTNDLGGYVEAGAGNYNDREFDGAFNFPIVEDKLLTRVAFSTQQRDGYTWILGTPGNPNGIDGDNRDTHSVRASVTFRPAQWLENDLVWQDVEYRSRATYGVLTALVPGGQFATQYAGVQNLLTQQESLGIRTVVPLSVDPIADGSSKFLTNITTIDLGENLTLKNIYGHDRESNTFAGDQDNTVYPEFDVYATPLTVTIWQDSDELQLAGKHFNHRLDWVIGAFYLDQPNEPNDPSHYAVANIGVTGAQLYTVETKGLSSKAAYGHAIYDLSEWVRGLKLSGGLRYSKDTFSDYLYVGSNYCTGPVAACLPPGGFTSPAGTITFEHSQALTWTASLEEQLTDRTLLYLTTSKGYRPGGQSGNDLLTGKSFPPFGPEYVLETDLGVKSDWALFGMPIRTNATIWHQDYTDIQEQVLASSFSFTKNAGSATLWGGELEALLELTHDLQFGLNYSHGYIAYNSFLPGVDPGTIAQLQASRTLDFPPNKVNVNLRYRLPLSAEVGEVSLQAHYNWQDTGGTTGVLGDLGLVKAFGLLNLSADWTEIHEKPIDLEFFVSNATNKAYLTQAVPAFEPLAFGYGNRIYGEPRMYGIRLKYRLGGPAK